MSETKNETTVTQPSDRELVFSRVFDAPQDRVFGAFATCDAVMRWFGPKLWPLSVCEMDFRVGGVWRYCMRGPAGEEAWGKAVYREIVRPERIVNTDIFTDADGAQVPGTPELLVTVTFAEANGKTTLTNRAEFATPGDLAAVVEMGMVVGVTETWDQLAEYLGN